MDSARYDDKLLVAMISANEVRRCIEDAADLDEIKYSDTVDNYGTTYNELRNDLKSIERLIYRIRSRTR